MSAAGMTTADALCVKVWHEELFRDTEKKLFFSDYEGTSEDSIVQVKRDLQKGPGDQVTFGIVPRLTGSFVTGSSGLTMEGREQATTSYSHAVVLEEYKLAARWKEGLDLQRPIFKLDEVARARLMTNNAENLDQLHFDALISGQTRIMAGNGSMYTTAATAAAAVTDQTAHKITPSLIRKLKTVAMTGGAVATNSDGSPARVFIPPRPIKIKGVAYYVLVVPPVVAFDLGENSAYHQALLQARESSPDNPIWTGAIANIDGVIIRVAENMPFRADGGGATIVYAKCILMGAQALVKAYGSYRSNGTLNGNTTEVVAKKFGYDEEAGICTKTICRVSAPTFNSERYGSMALFVACSNPAA